MGIFDSYARWCDMGIFDSLFKSPAQMLNEQQTVNVAQGASSAINALQAQAGNQSPGQSMGIGSFTTTEAYHPTSTPLRSKVNRTIAKAEDALPCRVLKSITSIVFEAGPNMAYVVYYIGNGYHTGGYERFENVDTFPTEADIARICLMAP